MTCAYFSVSAIWSCALALELITSAKLLGVNCSSNKQVNSWLNSLEERKHDEICLHNQIRDVSGPKEVTAHAENKKFYSITESSSSYIEGFLKKTVKDRIFLDFACGNGSAAIACAQQGALFSVGLDISDVSVKNAKQAARAFPEEISKRLFFYQGDCEDTNLPSSSIDIVLCSGMLHHLNLDKAYAELSRIIVPGGLIAIFSPAHNILYSKFDASIGHVRRYSKWQLRETMRLAGLQPTEVRYFNPLGAILWLFVNRFFGKTNTDERSIGLYDKFIVPIAQLLDAVSFRPFGQSIVGVAKNIKQI